MFFEGKSLVSIDVMTGIIFASPCACFILGMFWNKVSSFAAGLSIAVGIGSGILVYMIIPDPNVNYVAGNLCSLLVPFVVIIISVLVGNYEFNYSKLKNYEPEHSVHA